MLPRPGPLISLWWVFPSALFLHWSKSPAIPHLRVKGKVSFQVLTWKDLADTLFQNSLLSSPNSLGSRHTDLANIRQIWLLGLCTYSSSVWNPFPQDICSAQPFTSFKSSLKCYLPSYVFMENLISNCNTSPLSTLLSLFPCFAFSFIPPTF